MEFGHIRNNNYAHCIWRVCFMPGTEVSPSYELSIYSLSVIPQGSPVTEPTMQGKHQVQKSSLPHMRMESCMLSTEDIR